MAKSPKTPAGGPTTERKAAKPAPAKDGAPARAAKPRASRPRRQAAAAATEERAGAAATAELQFDHKPVDSAAPHAPAGPMDALTEFERGLLGDLLAVIEEHSSDAAQEIRRESVERAFVFACERHADQRRQVRRGLHHPSGRRGQDLRRACGSTPRRCAPRCCTTRSRTPAPRWTRCASEFGEEVAALVDGVTKLTGITFQSRDERAGRELPQDDGRDGQGRPGHPDQARRPAAQHAHARAHAEAEAAREGQGDARDLRAAGAPARHPRDQVGARGPRVRHAAPAQVQGDQGAGRTSSARSARATSRAPASTCEGARGGRHPRRRSRAAPSTSTRSTRR